MALVEYSDSESDPEQEAPPRKTAKICPDTTGNPQQASSLPPLPTGFHDLYASSTRVSVADDPSLHGGRKRAIPHVEGNWPTHIYLEWYPSKEELEILSSAISQVEQVVDGDRTEIHSLLHSELGAQLPLHISLSRPVILRTEQRTSFMDAFQAAVQDSNIPVFNTKIDGLKCFPNFENTRWFYVLRLKKPDEDNLNRLLEISNRSLALFDQPSLYKTAKSPLDVSGELGNAQPSDTTSADDHTGFFHISIAWSLAGPSTQENEKIASIKPRKLSDLSIQFDCLKAKIGNQVSSISLST